MTLNDALGLWGEYTQEVLVKTSYNYTETMNTVTAQGFIGWAYNKGYEIVDRKLDEDTARREEKKIMDEADYAELEKDIADSMKFDNPLSGGE